MLRLLLLSSVLMACTSSTTTTDASTTHDGPGSVIDAAPGLVDAPMGAACTGALYDNCLGNAGCMSQDCKAFTGFRLHDLHAGV